MRKTWVGEDPSYAGLWLCNLSPGDLPPPPRRGWWATRSQQQQQQQLEGSDGGPGGLATMEARTTRPSAYPVFYLSMGCRVGRTVDLMLFEPRYQLMMQRIMGHDGGETFVFGP